MRWKLKGVDSAYHPEMLSPPRNDQDMIILPKQESTPSLSQDSSGKGSSRRFYFLTTCHRCDHVTSSTHWSFLLDCRPTCGALSVPYGSGSQAKGRLDFSARPSPGHLFLCGQNMWELGLLVKSCFFFFLRTL